MAAAPLVVELDELPDRVGAALGRRPAAGDAAGRALPTAALPPTWPPPSTATAAPWLRERASAE